jgi:abortive infection Abi-like protein
MTDLKTTNSSIALSRMEIVRLVNQYIGVSGGYLGDFSYRTHADFYIECNLNINPYEYEGTTRERFITILSSLSPRDQAAVVRGIINRFPVGEGPVTQTAEARNEFLQIIQRLEAGTPIPSEVPSITSDVVSRAIADADLLLRSSGATSGVDRIHTALHGYLIAACRDAGIAHSDNAPTTALLKVLRSSHPKLADLGPRAQDIERVLNSCANILDAMNPVRNRASMAHPNDELLGYEEALLIINVGRTLVSYLDSKLSPGTT